MLNMFSSNIKHVMNIHLPSLGTKYTFQEPPKFSQHLPMRLLNFLQTDISYTFLRVGEPIFSVRSEVFRLDSLQLGISCHGGF